LDGEPSAAKSAPGDPLLHPGGVDVSRPHLHAHGAAVRRLRDGKLEITARPRLCGGLLC